MRKITLAGRGVAKSMRTKFYLLVIWLITGLVTGMAQPYKSAPAYAFHTLNYKISIDIYHCFTNPFPKSYNATLVCSLKADSTLNSVKLNADTSSLGIDSV